MAKSTSSRGRGRKSLKEKLQESFSMKDVFPYIVKETHGVETIVDACSALSNLSGVTVNPAALRKMMRDPKNQRRIKQSSSLVSVCNKNRGRPKNPEPVTAPA